MKFEYLNFGNLSPGWIVSLVCAAFLAGAIDAIVGGGGLIQLPVALMAFSQNPVKALGTHKLASVVGTASTAVNYARKVKINKTLVGVMFIFAFIGANIGANFASLISAKILNYLVLIALSIIVCIVLKQRELGLHESTYLLSKRKQYLFMSLGGLVCGFWDGIAGPGTGTLLIFFLVIFMRISFLRASAVAKIVNTGTNISALIVFIIRKEIVWDLAIVMAISNFIGSLVGVKYATRHGSSFVRKVFLVVAIVLILILGYRISGIKL